MEYHVVREVQKVESREGWHWGVVTEIPGQIDPRTNQPMKHIHIMPPDVFEWRAAEYDLDPEKDFETLLDMVLHGPFIPDPEDPRNHAIDAAGLTSPATTDVGSVVQKGDPVPTHLYNAETVEKARRAHLARVEHVKANVVRIGPPTVSLVRGVSKPVDPLDAIRAEPVIDQEQLQKKKEIVKNLRAAKISQVPQSMSRSSIKSRSTRPASRPLPPARSSAPFDDSPASKGKRQQE